jgi:hypothetical protein
MYACAVSRKKQLHPRGSFLRLEYCNFNVLVAGRVFCVFEKNFEACAAVTFLFAAVGQLFYFVFWNLRL